MWMIIVSVVLAFLACLSVMIGLGKRLPKQVKGLQIGFLVSAAVPLVFSIVELVLHQFNRPPYIGMHIVSLTMIGIATVGLGMDSKQSK